MIEPRAYYNEFDSFAAEWLRCLIDEGLIAMGDVDERSIEDVLPSDLKGYTQCHFFAGIGGWSYALRLAGWPDSRPCWTGSCPCQPFSAAGKGNGFSDERHLWPAFHWLIQNCRPIEIFGEQVASPDGLAWLDVVQADLEGTAYTSGAVDMCAAGIGAPHIRQRLFWGAYSTRGNRGSRIGTKETGVRANGEVSNRGNSHGSRLERWCLQSGNERFKSQAFKAGFTRGFWEPADWWYGRDEKYRPIEPGLFPLAHGVSGRMGKLRGYGNAIVPELAAEFIKAWEEIT